MHFVHADEAMEGISLLLHHPIVSRSFLTFPPTDRLEITWLSGYDYAFIDQLNGGVTVWDFLVAVQTRSVVFICGVCLCILNLSFALVLI